MTPAVAMVEMAEEEAATAGEGAAWRGVAGSEIGA